MPTGAMRIVHGDTVLLDEVALRLHNNEQGGWAMLASQWPASECTAQAEHRELPGGVTEIRAEGQLGFLDVSQETTIGPDGSVMLRYDCTVARQPERPELLMGLLLNLTMPEVWAEGQAATEGSALMRIARDLHPQTRLGAGPGTVRWETGDGGLPAIEIGTSGRANFFDSRRFSGEETPSYVLQLMAPSTPTTVGERFTMRVAVQPVR
jgi:hypothetical protein